MNEMNIQPVDLGDELRQGASGRRGAQGELARAISL
jgi:hypothetical protein